MTGWSYTSADGSPGFCALHPIQSGVEAGATAIRPMTPTEDAIYWALQGYMEVHSRMQDQIDRLAADFDAARAEVEAGQRRIAELEAVLAVPDHLVALSDRATPGYLVWWTSNSWLRLGTDARGHDRNGTPYGQDGYVAYPYVSRSDGHPDLCIRNDADRDLIVAAWAWVRDRIRAARTAEARRG